MDINFTDSEYLELLQKGRELLNQMSDLDIRFNDCTVPGFKSIVSNVGLCNDTGLCTEKRFALFPKQFKDGRFKLKYLRENHKCPLDSRQIGKDDMSNGCFYTCLLFKGKVKSIDEIKELYNKLIQEVTT